MKVENEHITKVVRRRKFAIQTYIRRNIQVQLQQEQEQEAGTDSYKDIKGK